jgi:hypothetical protein
MAAFNVLVQWYGLRLNTSGFVPLSIAEFSLQATNTIDYEGPTDVHVVGRNASTTEPARFVVVLLKAKGAPILTPVTDQ